MMFGSETISVHTERKPLSSDEQKQQRGTTTSTETERADESTDEDLLTPEEEKVVRARHGLAEDGDHELSFGVGASEEAREKMARLEDFLVGAFQERETGEIYFSDVADEVGDPDDAEAKEKIVDALKDED